MKKFLGLDIGDKRIGVAISEDSLVVPYGIISNEKLHDALSELGKIVREEKVQKIIIGIPKDRDTRQMDKIFLFAREISKTIQVPISYETEILTSKESERRLSHIKDKTSASFKEEVDKLSAKLILEQYVEKNN